MPCALRMMADDFTSTVLELPLSAIRGDVGYIRDGATGGRCAESAGDPAQQFGAAMSEQRTNSRAARPVTGEAQR